MSHRILYVITSPSLGGAQSHLLDLLQGFHESYDVHLATGTLGPLTDAAQNLNVPIHLLPHLIRSINPWCDAKAISEVSSLISIIQPDLIHAHSSKAGTIGRLCAHINKVPVIFTAHGWAFAPRVALLRRMMAIFSERLAAQWATKILCVSNSDLDLAIKNHVGNRGLLTTIHHGISGSKVASANPMIDPPRLVMVARFSEQKDHQTLLRAIALLNRKRCSVPVDFIGSGPLQRDCRILSDSLDISELVSFHGDRNDVDHFLTKAQIYVLATKYEGFPISILEAMRAGLPVVATGVNGIPEQVDQKRTGLLVPPGDVEALANALELVIRSPNTRKCMGDAGYEKFMRCFTLEPMLTKIGRIYEEILISATK